MKKQTLEEQVSRIKGMMKSVDEDWFGKPEPGESMYERFLESYDDEIREAVSKLGRVKYSELEAIPEDKWERVVNDIISTYGEKVLDAIQHWIATDYIDKHELAKFAVEHSDRTGTEKQMVIYAIEDFLRGIGRWEDDEEEEEDLNELGGYIGDKAPEKITGPEIPKIDPKIYEGYEPYDILRAHRLLLNIYNYGDINVPTEEYVKISRFMEKLYDSAKFDKEYNKSNEEPNKEDVPF